jgi:hypothetical protein
MMFTLALKMETTRFPEMVASTNQSTQQLNPKEHHQKCLLVLYIHILYSVLFKLPVYILNILFH